MTFEIIAVICITALAISTGILRFMRYRHDTLLQVQRESHLSQETAVKLTDQVNTLSKKLLDEVGEINRHINDLSEDFTVRLNAIPQVDLINLQSRLDTIENQVNKHDLSLTVRRQK